MLRHRVEELERELDAIINFSSDEIVVTNGEGIILRANSIFEDNHGVSVDEIIGCYVGDLEARRVFEPSVTRLVLQNRSPQTVIQSRKDGRKLLATGTPVFSPDGSVFRVIVNTRDITRLNELKRKLEETERLKERYYQELVELRRGSAFTDDILVSSPVMLELLDMVEKIAATDSTVLLTGESGVGKGVFARYLHEYSTRREKSFTVVNCGAIPDNLLESELFGYAGGAFTGARREGKIGKLELADQGTIFLDEITELPLNLQVKLLHVIQEGVISRIGDHREIRLNLRIIAATNRDIARMVAEGRFREDLYFRLNVIPLEIPPLRQRVEDIETLTRHFLGRFNQKYHKSKELAPEALNYFRNYRWPGNVRELENLLERMVIVVDEDCIGVEHLPRHIAAASPAVTAGTPGPAAEYPGTARFALPGGRAAGSSGSGVPGISGKSMPLQPLALARAALEKELFEEALRQCSSTYEIARVLGVNQSTVVRKLRKYGLARAAP